MYTCYEQKMKHFYELLDSIKIVFTKYSDYMYTGERQGKA